MQTQPSSDRSLPTAFRRILWQYALAVLLVAAAVILRGAFPQILGSTPYLVVCPAVVVAAALGGFGPGLVATLLATICVDLLFTEPIGRFSTDPIHWVQQAVFFVAGLGISVMAGMMRAAVERQQRQASELSESEKKYRAVAEHTHDWEFWLGPDGRFVYVSPACLGVTGYPADAFLTDPHLADRIVHPDDQELYNLHRGRGDEACATEEAEFRIVRHDGGIRWIAHACVPVFDQGGVFLGIRGSNRDVTERKQAERALAESRQRLAGIIDSAMDAIITVDESQRIILFNPAAERMFVCPADQAIGSPVDRFIPARFRAGHAAHIRHFGETGETARTMGHLGAISGLRTDGEEFPIEASISQVDIEGRKLFSVILRDITERKRAEETLRESEARYRTLFDSIDEGFCIIQMIFDEGGKPIDYVFLDTNPSFGKQTGLKDARGKSMRELAPKHEEHWFETYGRIALTGQPVRFQNRAEQLHRWYDVYAFRFGRQENRQVAILFNDITESRQMEEDVKAARDVAQRAQAEAEQASRAKDHFLAVLSHELRTPLTPVLATASMLQRDEKLDRETRQHLEVIRRNAELEARLIDDLLDVTRIVRGKVELDLRPTELCTVVRHAVEVSQPDIEARALHFGLQVAGPPQIVNADAGRLQQVFWNIIKNAVKFTPRNGCVGVRCSSDTGHAFVEVSDSGVGIEPEALSRIFSAFEQAGAATTRQFGGLGLGLAISKALVEMHGGTIEVRSEGKDKGSVFIIRLPLAKCRGPEAAAGPALSFAAGSESRPSPLRILLVEDHGDTARILSRLLIQNGHEVHAAGDIATALDLAGRYRLDLLLSDLGLPDGSGLDLMRALRQRGHSFPGIALTGYGQDQDIKQSLAVGFTRHLTKPVDVSRLQEAIAAFTSSR